jgi:hypothetical protein
MLTIKYINRDQYPRRPRGYFPSHEIPGNPCDQGFKLAQTGAVWDKLGAIVDNVGIVLDTSSNAFKPKKRI